MNDRMLLAGVDGGQTSTKVVIATGRGEVLGTGIGPACDHLNVPGGLERNRQAIHGALRSAASAARIAMGDLAAVGLGLTGAQRELDPVPRIEGIVREIASPATIWVGTDFVSNLAGASSGRPGVVVIAGGGSIDYGIDAADWEAISGGLGYLMDDEGSSWFLGIEGLQAAARAEDRRGEPTALVDVIRSRLGLGSMREILRVIYRADFERAGVSRLAPLVIDAAREGDAVARGIVDRGVDGLVGLALGVARQLHARGEAITAYPTGGVFGATDMVLRPFEDRLGTTWPRARVERPRFSPMYGALFRAAQVHGIRVDDAFLARIEATMPRDS